MKQLMKNALKVLGVVGVSIFFSLAILLGLSVSWMFRTWSNLTMEELVYHLNTPLDGTDAGLILSYINECLVPEVLIVLFLVIVLISFRKRKKKVLLCSSIMSLAVLGGSLYYFWDNLHVGDYMSNQNSVSTFIDDYYVNPDDVELVFPEQKRNLIYIFLESMETTYSSQNVGGAYPENYIPRLTQLAQENTSFSSEGSGLNGGYAMPGSTWTIGGMFAQTSGLPLNIPIDGNGMGMQESFFEGITAMGDILEKEGYQQSLLIGSEAVFGGRDKYFSSHGNYSIEDYVYAKTIGQIPEDYRVWWGYEDQKLFELAKDKLISLSEQDAPFNLTMLTVDTHFEDGYLCENCPDTYGDNKYANVILCSDNMVANFVDWVKVQPFYNNTTIVVVGDHPTMDSDFCEDIDSEYVRKVYTCFINSTEQEEHNIDRVYTTFDMFPTTIASMGVKIEGNRLGLGTNLFSPEQTLSERFNLDTQEKELSKKSEFVETMSKIDNNKFIYENKVSENLAVPQAVVEVGEYDYTMGVIPTVVKEIQNVENEVASIMIAVWTKEEQSDLQWLQMELLAEGTYVSDIDISSFGFEPGQYQIHAYVIEQSGLQHYLGAAVGIVP